LGFLGWRVRRCDHPARSSIHGPQAQSGQLLGSLLGQWPQLVTYTASFLTVGVLWVNHHAIFNGLRKVDRTIQFINVILLLTVVLVPYPTQLLGHYLNAGWDGSIAAAFYGVVMTVMSICFQALVAWALTHPDLLEPSVRERRLSRSYLVLGLAW